MEGLSSIPFFMWFHSNLNTSFRRHKLIASCALSWKGHAIYFSLQDVSFVQNYFLRDSSRTVANQPYCLFLLSP